MKKMVFVILGLIMVFSLLGFIIFNGEGYRPLPPDNITVTQKGDGSTLIGKSDFSLLIPTNWKIVENTKGGEDYSTLSVGSPDYSYDSKTFIYAGVQFTVKKSPNPSSLTAEQIVADNELLKSQFGIVVDHNGNSSRKLEKIKLWSTTALQERLNKTTRWVVLYTHKHRYTLRYYDYRNLSEVESDKLYNELLASFRPAWHIAFEKVAELSEVKAYLQSVPNSHLNYDHTESDKWVFHLYELKSDHQATANWFYVDMNTSEITDLLGKLN